MEFGGSLVEFMKTIATPVESWLKYHRGVHTYMKSLNEKLEELNCRKQDRESRKIDELLPEERRPRKRAKKEVELWLGKVEKIIGEVKEIERRVEVAGYLARAGLGKIISMKISEVEDLYRKGDFVDGLVEVVPLIGDILPTRDILEGETTSMKKFEEIWACLTNDKVRKVGVYGMSGIGKTTILKHINNRLLECTKKFDNVIWVTVSKASSNIIMLQDAIARKMNLDISRYEDELSRAAKLYEALSSKKRYVLILDDLWEVYSLHEVGIPEPTLENGCKLVLSTQFLRVCNGMNCRSIRMELLTQGESWTLFLDIVGHNVLSVPDLDVVVNNIVKECARLPLAIVTIAGSLKGIVDFYEWKTVLEELRMSAKGPDDMGSVVIQKLNLSYNRLKDQKLQDCLLYCALYPEDSMIERRKLIKDLIIEGMIEGMSSRQAEFEKGHAILNKLESSCLLEGSSNKYGQRFVKMHDLVRDMAISITNVGHRYLVEAGLGLKEIPTEEKWTQDLVRVSLMCNKISNIPPYVSPNCPSLSTLVLRHNMFLEGISNEFFIHMDKLNVLDLSFTSIKILPISISDLVNLKALLLRGCEGLENVPSLLNLRALKSLDCWKTRIVEVPEGLEMLVNLRFLDLHAKSLKAIPDGIFLKLPFLQHLSLPRFYSRTLKVNVDELASLRRLETLQASFLDIDHFNAFVSSFKGREMISMYTFHVGFHYFLRFYKCSRGVIVTNCNLKKKYSILVPKCIQVFHVINCLMTSLCSSIAQLKSFDYLRLCILSECSEIEYLLYSSSLSVPILQRLEELRLDCLWSLCGLVMKPRLLPIGTFSSLKTISVFDCPNMKSLFMHTLLPYLQNLVEIQVHKCEKMVEIISKDEEYDGMLIAFPKLRHLRLWGLPELKSISSYDQSSLVANSLEEVLIVRCPKLKRIDPIFCKELATSHPSLRKIKVEKKWWESLEWDQPSNKVFLEKILQV